MHETRLGTGYPRKLKGEEIPLTARILTIVDVFDALTSDRPYRPAMTVEKAVEMIRSRRGAAYDPKVADTLPAGYDGGKGRRDDPVAPRRRL